MNNGYNGYQNSPSGGFGRNRNGGYSGFSGTGYEDGLAAYSRKTFLWMFAGLAITFAISMFMAYANGGYYAYALVYSGIYYVMAIAEVVLVFVLGLRINKLSPTAATGIFLAYSTVNGFTVAPILFCYNLTSVIWVFAVCAGIFGALALYGYTTKRDLTKLGTICFIALIGILIYSIIAIFVQVPAMQIIVSVIAIVVFMGFTLYDTQKIKRYYEMCQGDELMLKKTAIISALQLYLDFINMFLYILRLFGNSR